MDPLTITGLVSAGSGLLSGFLGMGESPSEEAFRKMFDQLYENMDWLKETSFSKDELFNSILPAVQNTFRRSADVAAAKIGATVPETAGGTPEGQSFMDYYTTALAPIIAQGESQAGQAHMSFVDLWNTMDTQSKQRFLQAVQLGGNLAGGLPSMTEGQKFLTNTLQGADIGATIAGNIQMGGALNNKAGSITDYLGKLGVTNSSVLDVVNSFIEPRGASKTPLTPSPLPGG